MKVKILDDEHWWGANAVHAPMQPFDKISEYVCNLRLDDGNQSAPLLVSDKGRYIWSEEACIIKIGGGHVEFSDENAELYEDGEVLHWNRVERVEE